MPKRIGHLYEQMVTLENCIRAEEEMIRNKKKERVILHIREHIEEYGKRLYENLLHGYRFQPPYETDICDSYKGKKRHLKIPCLQDQAAMQAWLLIATPYIEKRNYYYNCGSIPHAGQTRAVNAIKKWLNSKKPIRYGASLDISTFYDSLPHWVVVKGLRRIFKDEFFIGFAISMMKAMNPNGIGLAIGYPVSHWLANVALFELDRMLQRDYPDVKFVRYMDDMPLLCNNKRKLRKAVEAIRSWLSSHGMKLKNNWQIFKIEDRGLTFLSYRFFHHYTILSKQLMYRIVRKAKRASKHLTLRLAEGVVSHQGLLKHCNSFNLRKNKIYPYIDPTKCRRYISLCAVQGGVQT